MTTEERAALNAEYAVACKGFELVGSTDTGRKTYGVNLCKDMEILDYLSDEADAWRRAKVLIESREMESGYAIRRGSFGYFIDPPLGVWYCESPEETSIRACIALKVQVP